MTLAIVALWALFIISRVVLISSRAWVCGVGILSWFVKKYGILAWIHPTIGLGSSRQLFHIKCLRVPCTIIVNDPALLMVCSFIYLIWWHVEHQFSYHILSLTCTCLATFTLSVCLFLIGVLTMLISLQWRIRAPLWLCEDPQCQCWSTKWCREGESLQCIKMRYAFSRLWLEDSTCFSLSL